MIYDDETALAFQTSKMSTTSFNGEYGTIVTGEASFGMGKRKFIFLDIFEGKSYCFVQNLKAGRHADYAAIIADREMDEVKANIVESSVEGYRLSHEYKTRVANIERLTDIIADNNPSRQLTNLLNELVSRVRPSGKSS